MFDREYTERAFGSQSTATLSSGPVRQLLITAGLLLPLALDTFALAAALGMAGLERRDQLRVALVFTVFEAGMPIAGLLVGRVIGSVIGQWAGYSGILFL